MIKSSFAPPVDRLRRRTDVVVMTALDLEYAAVRVHLVGVRSRQHVEGTLFETGRICGSACSVALVRVGPGNTATALIAERAIAMFRPKVLLFVGVAGALRDEIQLGDVVVATKIYAFQGGKAEGNRFLPRPQMWEADHGLEQVAGYVAREGAWTQLVSDCRQRPVVHLKPIASGEVVVNSRIGPIAEHLRFHFGDAVAVDMESLGVACTGHLNRSMPVLSIRGISDLADGDKHRADRAGWQVIAASHAAAFALTLATTVAP
jgi:adenosylhomocysteine nucleosidase